MAEPAPDRGAPSMAALVAALEARARERADAILAEAREEAARIRAAAEAETGRMEAEVLAGRERTLRAAAARRLADARSEAAREVLEARDAALGRVFERATAALPEAAASAAYLAGLPGRLEAALRYLSGERATAVCPPAVAPALRAAATGRDGLAVEAPEDAAPGFLLRSGDGRVTVDATLVDALERARPGIAIELAAGFESGDGG